MMWPKYHDSIALLPLWQFPPPTPSVLALCKSAALNPARGNILGRAQNRDLTLIAHELLSLLNCLDTLPIHYTYHKLGLCLHISLSLRIVHKHSQYFGISILSSVYLVSSLLKTLINDSRPPKTR